MCNVETESSQDLFDQFEDMGTKYRSYEERKAHDKFNLILMQAEKADLESSILSDIAGAVQAYLKQDELRVMDTWSRWCTTGLGIRAHRIQLIRRRQNKQFIRGSLYSENRSRVETVCH